MARVFLGFKIFSIAQNRVITVKVKIRLSDRYFLLWRYVLLSIQALFSAVSGDLLIFKKSSFILWSGSLFTLIMVKTRCLWEVNSDSARSAIHSRVTHSHEIFNFALISSRSLVATRHRVNFFNSFLQVAHATTVASSWQPFASFFLKKEKGREKNWKWKFQQTSSSPTSKRAMARKIFCHSKF